MAAPTAPAGRRPGFDYARARIQARLATLPSQADWQALNPYQGFATYLEHARQGPLARYLTELPPNDDPHRLEAALRRRFVAIAAELAGWLPVACGDLIEWSADLPYLSLAGREPPDPAEDPHGASFALRMASAEGDAAAWWLGQWSARACRYGSEAVILALWRRLVPFGRSSDHTPGGDAALALRTDLRLYLHRHLARPAMVLAWLGLVHLDLWRLRAELLPRLLFGREVAA